MKRRRVVLSPTAVEDFDRTTRFLVRIGASQTAARRYVNRIRDRCRKLGDTPFVGTGHEELAPGLRTVGFERSATIAFRVLSDRVEIVNVFYGGRDIEAYYREPSGLE